ncbi:acyl-CoA dehydrogenase [Actinomadura graeca]|uniref:Acyl-CoA dehydrogenase n=1 Tax=Actinomadura graeca TaxID=2750812 RepID=A0ABX8QTX7_9ACTN|nr:acyl-CoA dehydrogenase [Actinomadura graeca]QXJ21821.1 acyl-CoA dehydrogenase [Actinomadura graeca]
MTEATPDDLETRLGDPRDPSNPLSYEAVTAADERGEPLAAGEDMLDGFGLNAEFVPARLGGRLVQADRIGLPVRALFRRDPSLGLGYGVTSYAAAVPVWVSGSDDQQARLAALLLRGRKVAAAYPEPPHVDDPARGGPAARPDPAGLVLDGREELVGNAARADAIVLLARTGDGPGDRSHLLVETAALPPGRLVHLPRARTSGMRGLLLGGIEFDACPVPDEVVGERDAAMETVPPVLQATRAVLPGVVIGALDTQLRVAVDFARGRTLYGGSVAAFPNVRSALVGAFLDVLVCDVLATVAARALHLMPGEAGMLTAAAKHLVPRLLHEASYSLSVTVGARSYMREGRHAVFQKLMRDIPVAAFADAGAAVRATAIVPRLPGLATGARDAAEPPDALFDVGGDLPELDFGRLTADGGTARGLGALLAAAAADGDPRVAGPGGRLAAELDLLTARCAALPPHPPERIGLPRGTRPRSGSWRRAARPTTWPAATPSCSRRPRASACGGGAAASPPGRTGSRPSSPGWSPGSGRRYRPPSPGRRRRPSRSRRPWRPS